MKQMGRTHRHFYRIVAIDSRQPRDGKAIEDLGTYDPHVADRDKSVSLRPGRIKYWMSVGAQPTENVQAIFRRHMKRWEEIESQEATKAAADAAKAATAPAGGPAA
ncbi:MAG: 30S ribosomal protein S16 [Gemmataceae bacterium]|nr:30S ribosomal protein S16 [Gemmataceae bacterium]